jgi:predicted DNA-binding transcriptional regulator AlpA
MLTNLEIPLSHRRAHNRTDEDTISLIRRLAQYYDDEKIAGILNRQGRTTAEGLGFTRPRVIALRHSWGIPCYEPPAEPAKDELVGVTAIAEFIGVDRATVFYWLREGFIPGEQTTAGAPWRVRITDQLRARFRQTPPVGYVALREAMGILGISRQAVWKRVKRGELESTYVTRGRRKGLFVRVDNPNQKQAKLFKSAPPSKYLNDRMGHSRF